MNALNWDDLNRHVNALVEAALSAVDPAEAVRRQLRLEDDELVAGPDRTQLAPTSRLFAVGAGKAGVAMSTAAAEQLGDRLTAGVVAVPQAPAERAGPIRWIEAGHPLPNQGSVEAGRQIRNMLAQAGQNDIVLALISGGGSTLLELPAEGLSLTDLQATNDLLLLSGASIGQVNLVRQQLSQIKGGGLARMAGPATIVSLILSDVVGNPLDKIASGPTVPGRHSPQEALDLLGQLGLADQVPAPVIRHLRTAQPPPASESRGWQVLIGDNRLAAEAAAGRAETLGFRGLILTNHLEGEASQVGYLAAALAKSVRRHGDPVPAPACLILGGETTVTVRGQGLGGRNQELALAAAISLDGWERLAVATLATDGVDGPTPAAGAIVSGDTLPAARAKGLNAQGALQANDSHRLLRALGADLVLGPTGTNVNDLLFVLAYPVDS